MSKLYEIEMPSDLVEYIQRLDIEMLSQKTVITSMMDLYRGEDVTEWESFKSYHKRYDELYAEYQLAIQQTVDEYIPEEILNHKYRWEIIYGTNNFNLTIDCDCGTEIYENLKIEES